LKTSDFYFDLPEQLIAQEPPAQRGQSRLMTLDRSSGKRLHKTVLQLPDILSEERFLSHGGEKPLLVFNDTKVRKARLTGVSLNTGANAEFLLLERIINEEWKVLVQRSKRRKTGSRYVFFDNKKKEIAAAVITREDGEFKYLQFNRPIDDEFLDKYGSVPLPPYIKRKDIPSDAERYQTVYAKQTGSAAAPTAGLHFTDAMLDALSERGIDIAFITLHVGLGTFLPVRSENIEDHTMHEEKFIITEENASLIENAAAQKRKIIAVGTTSLRTLESAYSKEQRTKNNEQRKENKEQRTMNNEQRTENKEQRKENNEQSIKSEVLLKRGWQSTSIFIYPGYRFKIVDALFTNFHTPLSTLLMLVSAFAASSNEVSRGMELILESYKEAVREKYRFFSYGDAMLIY